MARKVTQTPRERFYQKFFKTENGCWSWGKGKTKAGYGCIYYNGKHGYAHRLSWELHKGKIKKGLLVCHKCDNPSCVNPEHLFLGTMRDNLYDCMRKGRDKKAIGEQAPCVKLSKKDVEKIRRMYQPHRHNVMNGVKLAKKYNVDTTTIYNILKGKTWKHTI